MPQQGPLFCVAFSPDSKTLLTGGEDTTVLLWDVDHLRRAGEKAKQADKPKAEKPAKPDAKELTEQPGREPFGPADNESPRPTDRQASDPAQNESAEEPSISGDKVSTQRTDKDADSQAQLEALWSALAGDDAGKAYEAIAALAAAAKQAVPFLQERLLVPPPPPPFDPQRLAQLIADLASNTFSVRQKATEQLEKHVEKVEAALREALGQKPSLEVRCRLERLLDRLKKAPSGDELRQVRAIQALEYVGTPEAKRVLEALAKRSQANQVAREAQASLQRLNKLTSPATPAP